MGRVEVGSHLGSLGTKVCSDGISSFHRTASHSPGSPVCPAEPGREKEGGRTHPKQFITERLDKLKVLLNHICML